MYLKKTSGSWDILISIYFTRHVYHPPPLRNPIPAHLHKRTFVYAISIPAPGYHGHPRYIDAVLCRKSQRNKTPPSYISCFHSLERKKSMIIEVNPQHGDESSVRWIEAWDLPVVKRAERRKGGFILLYWPGRLLTGISQRRVLGSSCLGHRLTVSWMRTWTTF